jgi:hypothetical protein
VPLVIPSYGLQIISVEDQPAAQMDAELVNLLELRTDLHSGPCNLLGYYFSSFPQQTEFWKEKKNVI